MKTLAVMGLLIAASAASAEPLRFSSGPSRTALIELYTSEGCSSCPPADRWLGNLSSNPGLWTEFVPVEFHVNYWDHLGWKDRLSSRAYTDREYAYAAAWGSGNVYTPCFVRNGAEWRPLWGGTSPPAAPAGLLKVDVAAGECRVEFQPVGALGGPGVAYEAHVALLGCGISSKVTAGENQGEKLDHDFVVLGLAHADLSVTGGATVAASLPAPQAGVTGSKRLALAAWVTRRDELGPLQATGGWLP
jgi:hypothetical protein